jgi:hypothetical protein
MRLTALYPGTVPVIFYDASTGKYKSTKGLTVSANPSVMDRLYSVFGKENVK